MARETCPAMLIITSSPAPDSDSSVTSVCRLSCSQKSCAAVDPHPCRQPSVDNPHPQPGQTSKESPSSPERVPVQEDAQSWYFRRLPLGLDVFPGISGAEATGGQEKYLGNHGGTAIW